VLRLLTGLLALGPSLIGADAPAHPSAAGPQFRVVPLQGGMHECLTVGGDALRQAGLAPVLVGDASVRGEGDGGRGFVLCVRRPRDGACGLDAATAVLVAAGRDAGALLERIVGGFRPDPPAECPASPADPAPE
jgi:hypothetical protein